VKETEAVEIEGVEEWKMGNFLKIQGVVKYLVQWKEFIAEYDT